MTSNFFEVVLVLSYCIKGVLIYCFSFLVGSHAKRWAESQNVRTCNDADLISSMLKEVVNPNATLLNILLMY